MSKIEVRDCPCNFPKPKKVQEMTLKEKKKFYSLPLDVQLYKRQEFNPPLGEPVVLDPTDEECWFANKPCVLVENAEELKLPDGFNEQDDYGPRSGEELVKWENYLASLPAEIRAYIESIIAQEEGDEEENENAA